MTLWAYALRTVAQVKASPWIVQGSGLDALIEDCANEASALVEATWGRHIVSRGALTEYHPSRATSLGAYPMPFGYPYGMSYGYDPLVPFMTATRSELYTNEWPIVSVTSINEDSARVYGAPTLLTPNTDYIASLPAGKIIRVSGALPKSWMWSWRAVKLVYVAGYQDTSGNPAGAVAVPFQILRVFDELVAWMIRQRSSKEVGMRSVSDGLGNRSFEGPAYVTEGMKSALRLAGADSGMFVRTGERDS